MRVVSIVAREGIFPSRFLLNHFKNSAIQPLLKPMKKLVIRETIIVLSKVGLIILLSMKMKTKKFPKPKDRPRITPNRISRFNFKDVIL